MALKVLMVPPTFTLAVAGETLTEGVLVMGACHTPRPKVATRM